MKNRKDDLARTLVHLIVSLKKLAASPERQIRCLDQSGMGDCADELALEFGDSFQTLESQWQDAGLTPPQFESLAAVDTLLGRMSGPQNALLWTRAALEGSAEWTQVRRLAAQALELLPSEDDAARRAAEGDGRQTP